MRTSYNIDDVEILLTDITGLVEPEDTKTREKKIQNGKHYCEMLPIEYEPTEEYEKIYYEMMDLYAPTVASAVCQLAERILKITTKDFVLVSLARAGIPAGILLKHYFDKNGINVPHYAISIIRGRGIDRQAMDYIELNHQNQEIIFVDGWTGKGAIRNQLDEAMNDYFFDWLFAVIADPAGVADIYGTSSDIMIPSSCLNSTVSGLISRTFLRDDIISLHDYHGAIYYEELETKDKSYEFINGIERYFNYNTKYEEMNNIQNNGEIDINYIKNKYFIDDINLIKPGIGETTRVLLRRVPDIICISESFINSPFLKPVLRLAEEKNVKVVQEKLVCYKCIGIIKKLSDA